jgi:hypothetical protein
MATKGMRNKLSITEPRKQNFKIDKYTLLYRLENYNLTVTLVKEEDGGEYEVRAENEMGNVSSKSTVTIHSEYTTSNSLRKT